MDHNMDSVLAWADGLDSDSLAGLVHALREKLPCNKKNKSEKLHHHFVVPEDIRCLAPGQLKGLEQAALDWVTGTTAPQTKRARNRLRFTFLLLRHSGAKLGEVLCLDDTKAFDFKNFSVTFPGGNGHGPENRQTIMPQGFMHEIELFLDSPEMAGLRGEAFHLDPGYVRKKLYELAVMADVPKELVNPTSIRNSRAVELLRMGTPLPLLQTQLGLSNLESASAFCSYPDQVAKKILSICIQENFPMKTSARNTFSGLVTEVDCSGILCEVTIKNNAGMEVTAIITTQSCKNLGIEKDRPVTAMIKAPWVLVSTDDASGSSARNKYKAKVTNVQGDNLVVEVSGELEDGSGMCALLTGASVDALDIKKGDDVIFFFKAMHVILTAD